MILRGVILYGIFLASLISVSTGEESLLINRNLIFDCGNEKVVPIIYKCDGEDDCGNGVDEQDCSAETIFNRRLRNLEIFYRILSFDCGNGERVPLRAVCNMVNDCGNGADERDCEHNGFDCGNGKKVPKRYLCDNDDDCGNGADEKNCTQSQRRISSPCAFSSILNFDCGNGRTVPRRVLCDGDDDCGNGADEKNCTDSARRISPLLHVTLDRFDCGNGRTVPKRYLCDGDDDCQNGADERDCTLSSGMSLRFDCGNGRTVLNRYLCDGENNCLNGADERNCTNSPIITHYSLPSARPSYRARFDCGNGKQILERQLCDLRDNCGNGADERNCSNVCGAILIVTPFFKRVFSYTKSGQEHLENHRTCNWIIQTMGRVEVEFLEFRVGSTPTEDISDEEVVLATHDCEDKFTGDCVQYNSICPDDYVEVFDGPNDSSSRLGRFCGNSIPPTVRASKNTLLVRFNPGRTGQPARFVARYSNSDGVA